MKSDSENSLFIVERINLPGNKKAPRSCEQEAIRLKDEHISTEHLFLAIFSKHNTPAAGLLEGAGLIRDRVYDAIQQMRG